MSNNFPKQVAKTKLSTFAIVNKYHSGLKSSSAFQALSMLQRHLHTPAMY